MAARKRLTLTPPAPSGVLAWQDWFWVGDSSKFSPWPAAMPASVAPAL